MNLSEIAHEAECAAAAYAVLIERANHSEARRLRKELRDYLATLWGRSMIGNRVKVYLCNPLEQVVGELRRQNAEGVWIYARKWDEAGLLRFYPSHRIVEMEDLGEVHR